MNQQYRPSIQKASVNPSLLNIAIRYLQHGWNVIPLQGKRPSIHWRVFQKTRVSEHQLKQWYRDGLMGNIGLVCGQISNRLVILDIDSEQGYLAFKRAFPKYVSTYTVQTGSGVGYHLYWYVQRLPKTLHVRTSRLGNLDLLSSGCQAVAPPSRHPRTSKLYQIQKSRHILKLDHVDHIQKWLTSLREPQTPVSDRLHQRHKWKWRTREELIVTLATYFSTHRYRQRGMWLNGSCVYPHRHKNRDIHPSFGFNTHSGFGHCFVCGTLSLDELCDTLNITIW